MELYAGLDLHSSNTYIGIMDKTFNRVFKKRVPNDLERILETLKPFQDQISRGDVKSLLLDLSKTYSRSSVSVTKDVISGIFEYAIDEELIDRNPTVKVMKKLGPRFKKVK